MKYLLTPLLMLVLVGLLAIGSEAQRYKALDLGVIGAAGDAQGINDASDVVGGYCVDSGCNTIHPFLWTPAQGFQDLGTLPNGGSYGFANGLNDLLQVVGESAFSQPFMGNTHAFLWTSMQGMQDLGTLGCPDITGASAINAGGQGVGTSTIAPCPGGGSSRAFLWTAAAGMQNLGTLTDGTFSVGEAVNDVGLAAGFADCGGCAGHHAFVWTSGTMQDLGTLPGGTESTGRALNDFEVVVGDSDSAQSPEITAFGWTQQDGMRDLGTLPGGVWSSAAAVNNCNEIVGSSDSAESAGHSFKRGRHGRPTGDGSHAFIWSERKGMRDLNTLIIPARSGWLLTDARAINSSGQIAGVGTFNGQRHAFLLIPTAHPHCKTR